MHIAICDDDMQELATISKMLDAFREENELTLSYELFNSPSSLLDKIKKEDFDLLLLDVVMPEMNGIELASIIRSNNNHSPIVFLTSSPEYAVSSYRVQAADYLLKPIDQTLLYDVIRHQIMDKEQFLVVKTMDSITQVPIGKIVYLEVVVRKVYIHLVDGTVYQPVGTLSAYEERLLFYPQFYKPHRSYLIHFDYISKIDKEGIHTVLGNIIPIPRPRHAQTKNDYMNYLMS